VRLGFKSRLHSMVRWKKGLRLIGSYYVLASDSITALGWSDVDLVRPQLNIRRSAKGAGRPRFIPMRTMEEAGPPHVETCWGRNLRYPQTAPCIWAPPAPLGGITASAPRGWVPRQSRVQTMKRSSPGLIVHRSRALRPNVSDPASY